jgi:WD40 repeat protein/transcriptional regulator with XRE-family HTH domain
MPRPQKPINPEDGPLAAFAHALRALRERAGAPTYRRLADKTGLSVTTLSQAAAGRALPTWKVAAAFVRACGGNESEWHARWVEAAEALQPGSQPASVDSDPALDLSQRRAPLAPAPTAVRVGPGSSAGLVPSRASDHTAPGSAGTPRSPAGPDQSRPAGATEPDHVTAVLAGSGLPDPDRITTKREFAAALSVLREQTGLTIRDVAHRLGRRVPVSTLGDWFSGRGLPSRQLQSAFCEYLRVCGVIDVASTDRWWAARDRVRTNEPMRRAVDIEPYRGLASFGVDDTEWFFGRDTLIEELLGHVRAMHDDGGGLLVVVGASGSGKSSLLRAGLLPALHRGAVPASETWPVLVMTPGHRPNDELAELLAGRTPVDVTTPTQDPAEYPGLGDPVVLAAPGDRVDGRRLVLVVDQFEQLFTACADEDERQRYVSALCAAAARPRGALVIVALRADFYAAILRYPRLLAAVRKRLFTVGPMSEAELRDVIVRPAQKAKIEIEDGLVELLLRDVSPRSGRTAHEVGILPLLSHTLYTVWEQGQRRRLTVSNYQQAGGIDAAVALTADQTYAELTAAQRQMARWMFLRLVHIQPDAADTRRRVPLDELLSGADRELDVVLDRFVTQRLITIDLDTVEITHEALLTAWPQLRIWLDTDRHGLLAAQQLNAAATTWHERGREPDSLYRGTRLEAARAWADEHPAELPQVTCDFLDASQRHTHRQTRRLLQVNALLAALVALAAALGIVATQQRSAAEQARKVALSQLVAAKAAALRGKDVALSRQLALAAYRIAPTAEAEASLLDASADRPAIRIRTDASSMSAATFDPSAAVLATAQDTTVRLWNVADVGHPKPLAKLPNSADGRFFTLAFRPDGGWLAAAGSDAAIYLWDVHNPATPVQRYRLPGLAANIYSLAFSPDGQLLAAGYADGTVRLWRMDGGSQPVVLGQPLVAGQAAAWSVTFHPNGKFIATGADSVRIWDVTDPARPALIATPPGVKGIIGQVAFSPDGQVLAAGSRDSNAYLWNVTDPRKPAPVGAPLPGATSWINGVAFSPDSGSLVLASSDGTVRVVDLRTRRVSATLAHPAPATAVDFSPDGTTLVTAASDGVARLWPLPGTALPSPATVYATKFSPDGRILAVASEDTQLWDMSDPTRPKRYDPALPSPDHASLAAAFSPDGRLLAAGHGSSGGLQLWAVADPAHPVALGPALHAHQQQIESLTFNPDGKVLATASRDGTVRLWDIANPAAPAPLATLGGFTNYVMSVAISPDGRLLAAGSSDGTVRLWNIAKLAAPDLVSVDTAHSYIYSVAFSPDGRMVAAGSADGTIRLYDVTNPARPASSMTGPNNAISIAFNAGGLQLAVAATDGTIWRWDLHQRDRPAPLATLTIPGERRLYTLDFHPGDDRLAAGASDAVWLWHTDPKTAAANICASSGDPITIDEWARYVPGLPYQPPCRAP